MGCGAMLRAELARVRSGLESKGEVAGEALKEEEPPRSATCSGFSRWEPRSKEEERPRPGLERADRTAPAAASEICISAG